MYVRMHAYAHTYSKVDYSLFTGNVVELIVNTKCQIIYDILKRFLQHYCIMVHYIMLNYDILYKYAYTMIYCVTLSCISLYYSYVQTSGP